jgi:hypothetical protein
MSIAPLQPAAPAHDRRVLAVSSAHAGTGAGAGAGAEAQQIDTVVAELPEEPKPVTPATVAVHMMNVPRSRVLEAFVALHRELGEQADALSPADPAVPPPGAASAAAYSADKRPAGGAAAGQAIDLEA